LDFFDGQGRHAVDKAEWWDMIAVPILVVLVAYKLGGVANGTIVLALFAAYRVICILCNLWKKAGLVWR
jgi:hypothetical protein